MGLQLSYDPRARYEVSVSDVEYRCDETGSWLARIYRPQAQPPFPVLLDIHGGAWSGQDRTSDEALSLDLASSGLLVVAVDFRLAPAHPYPAQVADAHYAIRWLKAHAHEFGGEPRTLGAIGTSSGGHTVLLTTLRPNDPRYAAIPLPEAPEADAGLAYVILNSAVIDPYARYVWAKSVGNARLASSTEGYFLAEDVMHEANPQEILERGSFHDLPPVLLIHGTADQNYPQEIPERFVPAYRAAGGEVQFEQFPGMHHVFVRDPGPETDRARRIIKEFIARHLPSLPAEGEG